MSKTTSYSRSKSLFNLFLVVLIDLIGFGMIIPLIPFLGKSTGASPVLIGFLMAIYSIMQFLFSPFWGGISDRFGRKPVLLISILGAGIAHLTFSFVHSYLALFLTRMFAGLFSANISTAMASASDLSSKENRTQTMGLIGAAFGLGFVIGPFIGAKGAEWGIAFGFGDQFASLIASLLCFVNFFICWFFYKESLLEKNSSVKINFSKLNPFSALSDCSPEIKKSVGLFFTATFALALIEIVLFLTVEKQFGWGYKKAAYGFALIGLIMALTQGGLIRPLKKYFSNIQLIALGGVLFTLGLHGAFYFSTLLSFGLSITLLSLGYALLNPSLSGHISLLSSQTHQGQTFGVTHGFSALSRILGPVLGTFLMQEFTYKTPYLVSGTLIGLAIALFLYHHQK